MARDTNAVAPRVSDLADDLAVFDVHRAAVERCSARLESCQNCIELRHVPVSDRSRRTRRDLLIRGHELKLDVSEQQRLEPGNAEHWLCFGKGLLIPSASFMRLGHVNHERDKLGHDDGCEA